MGVASGRPPGGGTWAPINEIAAKLCFQIGAAERKCTTTLRLRTTALTHASCRRTQDASGCCQMTRLAQCAAQCVEHVSAFVLLNEAFFLDTISRHSSLRTLQRS